MAIGLIVNELLTNSFATRDENSGVIRVEFRIDRDRSKALLTMEKRQRRRAGTGMGLKLIHAFWQDAAAMLERRGRGADVG